VTVQLSRGRSRAWAVDLHAARKVVERHLNIFPDERLEYQKGRYLCPIDRDWEDSRYVQVSQLGADWRVTHHRTREAFVSAPQCLIAGSWPSVLYQNLTFDPVQPWEGFLMNDLLLKVVSMLRLPLLNAYYMGLRCIEPHAIHAVSGKKSNALTCMPLPLLMLPLW
jgi:hypothetical protein